MRVLSLTNTYLPHVGGVARSVESFRRELERQGHEVRVVAPEFEGSPHHEEHVIRVPALEKFNGSDFSVRLPVPGFLLQALEEFRPDVVHAHHPFLLGDTALRIAAEFDCPLVFTHHTMYENYTHYVPGDSPVLQQLVVELSTAYANLADHVLAPSESVATVLVERGVESPVSVLPTGIDVERFFQGEGATLRRSLGIPPDAFVVGHLGRLALEKNLGFLTRAVKHFLKRHRRAHFLVGGSGPFREEMERQFRGRAFRGRVHFTGTRADQDLVDFYHALDVFAFSSRSETQGLVLTEAMAAGVPVVALDAPGAREVVEDGRNGRLLARENRREFVAALAGIAGEEAGRRRELCDQARETARSFSIERQTRQLVEIYESLGGAGASRQELDDGPWEATLRRFQVEWDLWTSRLHLLGSSIHRVYLDELPIFGALRRSLRWLRRGFSRSDWTVRLAGLSTSEGTAGEPGLILIQIDGLSRSQLDRALSRRRMRFLRRLLLREGHELGSMYSGLPSTTPAFQGELFYGVKTAVPAFGFRDHETGETVRMLDPGPSSRVQRRLGREGPGLLEGGSAYSDIYSGGAAEAHYCASTLSFQGFWRAWNPLKLLGFLIFHFPSVLRVALELGLEFIIALVDGARGIVRGQSPRAEMKFIPTRVGINVLLRELITIGASIDVARGLPVIHLNYLGYDEQSHRRGPDSAFAHRALDGIDRCLRRIWVAQERSTRRDYQVWLYSDHGQERVTSYIEQTGKSLESRVASLLEGRPPEPGREASRVPGGIQIRRSRWLGQGGPWRLLPVPDSAPEPDSHAAFQLMALGPIGHLYLDGGWSRDRLEELARRLVEELEIPLVLARRDGGARAWTRVGVLELPGEIQTLLGDAHPFAESVEEDLVRLCHHPDAGTLILSGWRGGERPLSFPLENGAHAGPGPDETRGFTVLPAEIRLDPGDRPPRALDLRQAALRFLGRLPEAPFRRDGGVSTSPRSIRLMTYNVHACIGVDGKLSPRRIARLIGACQVDIIALQELDVGRDRTSGRDQVQEIASRLQMDAHFHASLEIEGGHYGNAILSRFPLELVRSGRLPRPGKRLEPRGALWVVVQVGGHRLQVITTHLGLRARERDRQAAALLGEEWLGHSDCTRPRILCGDFNATPRSGVYRALSEVLPEVQDRLPGHRPLPTWSSVHPFRRLDHVFADPELKVQRVEVPRFHLARRASDHLPLIVELALPEAGIENPGDPAR